MNRKSILHILLIQVAVIIYTFSSVAAKYASSYDLFSMSFIFWCGLQLCMLGIYAIFWQQIIKRFDLSIAYANRASAIFWSMLWAVLLFNERVTLNNMIGVLMIFAGVILVNSDEH